ncbi:MAG: DUF2892 domain-containing protein [Kiritimatiellae bacterium]|nr:DUF2892 domain-containing protein [Kiritimatiellia bacterium]MCO5045833.1 DUF2892 domain-containing protein [Kiritimatiellia bacterium]MCO5061087.1 DUF2892 domain-containing protein [Kiritimatiellia bacterium]MCO5067857.1 DUF2892 domain-containing protein [Kiritimatiellia bacterium]MCO6400096.1 DUF2892 domain-containing protein [Verrucomicrobiota bacterium]
MTVENGVRMLAGSMVLISLSLGIWVNSWWFALTAFVGLNLLQSAFTGICPAVKILTKLGFKAGSGS